MKQTNFDSKENIQDFYPSYRSKVNSGKIFVHSGTSSTTVIYYSDSSYNIATPEKSIRTQDTKN